MQYNRYRNLLRGCMFARRRPNDFEVMNGRGSWVELGCLWTSEAAKLATSARTDRSLLSQWAFCDHSLAFWVAFVNGAVSNRMF